MITFTLTTDHPLVGRWCRIGQDDARAVAVSTPVRFVVLDLYGGLFPDEPLEQVRLPIEQVTRLAFTELRP